MGTQKPEVSFSYTNEFGDYTEYHSNLSESDTLTELDSLILAFRYFLLACGFNYQTVNDEFPEE